jgi:hypothetical protein
MMKDKRQKTKDKRKKKKTPYTLIPLYRFPCQLKAKK